jgi:hypothetical protein
VYFTKVKVSEVGPRVDRQALYQKGAGVHGCDRQHLLLCAVCKKGSRIVVLADYAGYDKITL